MKDIKNINVGERHLYLIDEIPFSDLTTVTNLGKIFEPYAFRTIDLGEDENKNFTAISMKNGEFKENDKLYKIIWLTIDPISITFRLAADSSVAKRFYDQLHKKLSDIDNSGKFQKSKPMVTTQQTACVVTFSFEVQELLNEKFFNFASKIATKSFGETDDHIDQVSIILSHIQFSIQYKLKDADYSLTEKGLTIEPRTGTVPHQKIYFTASPTDSKAHLNLLDKLEKEISKK